jgi:hypothetical protein
MKGPKPGETVTVYYDPHDPAVNSIIELHEKSGDVLGPVPLMLLGVGAVVFIIIRRKRSTAKSAVRHCHPD